MCFPGAWVDDGDILSTVGSYAMGPLLAISSEQSAYEGIQNISAIPIVPWALPSTIAIPAWQGLLNEQYGGSIICFM